MEPEWNHPFLPALVLTRNFEPYFGAAHAILSRQITPWKWKWNPEKMDIARMLQQVGFAWLTKTDIFSYFFSQDLRTVFTNHGDFKTGDALCYG